MEVSAKLSATYLGHRWLLFHFSLFVLPNLNSGGDPDENVNEGTPVGDLKCHFVHWGLCCHC